MEYWDTVLRIDLWKSSISNRMSERLLQDSVGGGGVSQIPLDNGGLQTVFEEMLGEEAGGKIVDRGADVGKVLGKRLGSQLFLLILIFIVACITLWKFPLIYIINFFKLFIIFHGVVCKWKEGKWNRIGQTLQQA